jgi:hypothetical protein
VEIETFWQNELYSSADSGSALSIVKRRRSNRFVGKNFEEKLVTVAQNI